jgi:hypothetical protein
MRDIMENYQDDFCEMEYLTEGERELLEILRKP